MMVHTLELQTEKSFLSNILSWNSNGPTSIVFIFCIGKYSRTAFLTQSFTCHFFCSFNSAHRKKPLSIFSITSLIACWTSSSFNNDRSSHAFNMISFNEFDMVAKVLIVRFKSSYKKVEFKFKLNKHSFDHFFLHIIYGLLVLLIGKVQQNLLVLGIYDGLYWLIQPSLHFLVYA